MSKGINGKEKEALKKYILEEEEHFYALKREGEPHVNIPRNIQQKEVATK
ncbi:MAG: hypothetical protein V1868_02220 [Patescibacteria group bacterium]